METQSKLGLKARIARTEKLSLIIYQPLIVVAGSPEHHDHTEYDGEQQVPEGIINPEIPPLRQTLHHLVILDAPEHEDDTGDDAEHQGVGEVFVD